MIDLKQKILTYLCIGVKKLKQKNITQEYEYLGPRLTCEAVERGLVELIYRSVRKDLNTKSKRVIKAFSPRKLVDIYVYFTKIPLEKGIIMEVPITYILIICKENAYFADIDTILCKKEFIYEDI